MGAEALGEGSTIGGYVVEARLGAGGFGEVFRARHPVIGSTVAIKVLHAKYAQDEQAIARFIAEARAVNRVKHPNIVEIHDFGQLDDRHYCVMEYVRGTTLRELLRERGRLPLDEALPILRGIADAVDAAHAAGIAHRDLKPDNVFVREGGGVVLIDFGLAKLVGEEVAVTQTGAVFGTPMYMSPEQCRGKGVDERTDAYSFGVLAYHVLAGVPPFDGTALDLALHHLNDRPAPPSSHAVLPRRIDQAVLALLAKNPAERPMPLGRAVAGMAGGAAVKPRRRARVAIAVAGLAVAAGGAALVVRARSEGVARAWSSRFVGVPVDGGIHVANVSADGATLHYKDDSGSWKLDIASGSLTAEADPNAVYVPARDGRTLVIGSEVFLESAGGKRQRLDLPDTHYAENVPHVSNDGTRIVALDFAAKRLVIQDVATGARRTLVDLSPYWIVNTPRWSNDDQWILWDRSSAPDGTYETRVSDGLTRPVFGLTLDDSTVFNESETLADGDLVYCANDARGRSIRLRERGDLLGLGEQVIAPLDPSVATCMFTVAANGRVVATLGTGREHVGTIDLSAPRPELRMLGAPDAYDRTAAALGSTGDVVTTGPDGAAPVAISAAAHAERPLRACPGDTGWIAVGAALRHLELSATPSGETVRLRDDRCAVLSEWQLPPGPWSAPRCDATACFTMRVTGDRVAVWRLALSPSSAQELVAIPGAGRAASASIGISPAGDRLVVLARDHADPFLVDVAQGTATEIPLHAEVQSVGWASDPDRYLFSSMNLGDRHYGVFRGRFDGTSEPAWSSDYDWFRLGSASAATPFVVGSERSFRTRILVLDPD